MIAIATLIKHGLWIIATIIFLLLLSKNRENNSNAYAFDISYLFNIFAWICGYLIFWVIWLIIY